MFVCNYVELLVKLVLVLLVVRVIQTDDGVGVGPDFVLLFGDRVGSLRSQLTSSYVADTIYLM